MPYDRDEYDKLAKGPVCRLDNGLVEVGGVYRALLSKAGIHLYENKKKPKMVANNYSDPYIVLRYGDVFTVVDIEEICVEQANYSWCDIRVIIQDRIYWMQGTNQEIESVFKNCIERII